MTSKRVPKPGLKKLFWSLHMGRETKKTGSTQSNRAGNWFGVFPAGFEKKLQSEFPECFVEQSKPMIHLCSGLSLLGDVRVDINQNSNATLIHDATDLSDVYTDGSFGFCLIDPYYSEADYQKVGQKPLTSYAFTKEADRLVRVGGYIGVLHQRPPRKPKDCELVGIVAISVGPDRLLRMLQIWKKVGNPTK